MTAAMVVELLDVLDSAGIETWLDGGWAADAVLGVQRRAHDDVDLIARQSDVGALVSALATHGFEHVHGGAPKSFELVDEDGHQVDVHPILVTPSGDGRYLMEDGEDWVYPARGFTGVGVVAAREVRCLSPEIQMLCHGGYEPHRPSYDDVWALSSRFRIAVPPQYQAPRNSYPVRSADGPTP
jgi:lincosamide nucleotidyltransferase A/C/D/E